MWGSYSWIIAGFILMNMKIIMMLLWQYISPFIIPKITEKKSFKEDNNNDLIKYDTKMNNKTIKTVIVYVRDARNCAEPSTYMTSFNFSKEPLISSPLYTWYPHSGTLNNWTKVTNLVSDRARLQDCGVIKVKITRHRKIKAIQMRKEVIFPKIFILSSQNNLNSQRLQCFSWFQE